MSELQTTSDNYDVAYEYTVRFYPRWFTWIQFYMTSANSEREGTALSNRLTGPDGMGPEYKIVVAINDDTIYAEAFLDVTAGPVVLVIPPYANSYSILQLDVFGDILTTALTRGKAPSGGGTFVFVGPSYTGTVPQTMTRVDVPYDFTTIAIRVDKYASSGQDLRAPAAAFRSRLRMQTLADFNANDPAAGATLVMPLYFFSPSVKVMADEAIAASPAAFLRTLMVAMASPTTAPLTADDQALIQQFFDMYQQATLSQPTDSRPMRDIILGAQAAHAAIVDRWQSKRGVNGWIHFDNIGHWGTSYLDRAALTEYIQCGNGADAAYYADVFVDDGGLPLDGASYGYTVQFTKASVPDRTRFWSVTAYTPGAIELVPNALNKYVVASYTPELVTAPDGSITLYVQASQPRGVPQANWLPVPSGPFSLMLRVYGPTGNTYDAQLYAPPGVHRTPRLP